MSDVLLLADTFPPNRGGSETYLSTLATGLTERGHRVRVLTPATKMTGKSERAGNLTVRRSRLWKRLQDLGGSKNPHVSRLSRALLLPYLIVLVLISGRVDAFIAGHILPAGLVGRFARRLLRFQRFIIVTYGEEITMYSRGKRMPGLMAKAIDSADALTCLTESSRHELDQLRPGSADKIYVVPPSVEVVVSQCKDAPSLIGNPKIFTLSRLAERKGMDITIEAVAALRDRLPDIHYYIAGEGPDRERLETLATQLDLGQHVTFLGSVSCADVLFRQCDIFCMPNRQLPSGEREGFGIVFLEAGLRGKPSIAGRSGGAVDAVIDGETGIVVSPESVSEVSDAISYLALNPDVRQTMGRAAKAFAEQFTADRLVTEFEALIESSTIG